VNFNPIELVMAVEHTSFVDAVRVLLPPSWKRGNNRRAKRRRAEASALENSREAYPPHVRLERSTLRQPDIIPRLRGRRGKIGSPSSAG
jgi:hypothetical protein